MQNGQQDPPVLQQPQQKRWVSKSYMIGIGFIVSVSIIWAASSVFIQYIYNGTNHNNHFHSPFLVTYMGVSLFTLWLPTQRLITKCQHHYHHRNSMSEYQTIPLENGNQNSSNMRNEDDFLNDERPLTSGDVATTTTCDEVTRNDDTERNDNDVGLQSLARTAVWTEYDHIRTAVCIAPVWFIANWSYNSSLIYTSITSSTVLASTGSLFTYLFAILTNDETLNTTKFVGVVLGVLGSCITTLSDTTPSTSPSTNGTSHVMISTDASSNDNFVHTVSNDTSASARSMLPVLGDILGLLSAIGYGAYAVQTRIYCPKDESVYSMQTVLGYIGLCNFIALSPIALYILLSGQSQLTWMIVGFLVVKGLFDNVLSDYLWLRAVILTNATTATVGLGLTIPLAFASDILLGKQGVVSSEQIIGAVTVLAGFVLVNIGNNDASTSVINDIDTVDEFEASNNITNHTLPLYHEDNTPQRGQEIVTLPTVS